MVLLERFPLVVPEAAAAASSPLRRPSPRVLREVPPPLDPILPYLRQQRAGPAGRTAAAHGSGEEDGSCERIRRGGLAAVGRSGKGHQRAVASVPLPAVTALAATGGALLCSGLGLLDRIRQCLVTAGTARGARRRGRLPTGQRTAVKVARWVAKGRRS